MPVKKMTPESCRSTDAGSKSTAILPRKRRSLKLLRNAVLKGSFLGAFLALLAAYCAIEVSPIRAGVLAGIPLTYMVLFMAVNHDRWIFKED